MKGVGRFVSWDQTFFDPIGLPNGRKLVQYLAVGPIIRLALARPHGRVRGKRGSAATRSS
jgi:hypothetical protein